MERKPLPKQGESLVDDQEQRPRRTPGNTRRLRSFRRDFDPQAERRVGWAVCVLSGCAFLVAATIIVVDVVGPRPVPGVTWLALPAILIVAAGQLWRIGDEVDRRPPGVRRSWGPFRWRSNVQRDDSPLPRSARVAVAAVIVLLAVSAITAFARGAGVGGPTSPTRQCPYPLDNHGVITCTTEARYYEAGRDVQRFVASILALALFSQLGTSAGEILRRRRED